MESTSASSRSAGTVVNGAKLVREDKLVPRYLIVNPAQHADLAKTPQFARADQSGDQKAFREGFVGRIYGMDVFETTQIEASSSKAKAIIMAEDQVGEPCFGIAVKSLPQVRTERHELGRYTDIVGVEEYDIQLLRANGLCTIESYSA